MTKIKHFALTMLLALVGNLSVSAADFEVDGIYYEVISLSDLTCMVTYSGKKDPYGNLVTSYSGDVTIPSSVTYSGKTFSVTEIGNDAFAYCSGLTSVEIPNSVTKIRTYAFNGCI